MTDGIKTPLANAGLFTFTGGLAGDWFGPGEAPSAVAQVEAFGRAFDFQTGYNLQQRPRAYEGVTFEQLRGMADGYDLLRLAIETRKDQMDPLAWTIKGRDGTDGGAEAKRIQEALQSPDRENTWHQWLRMLMEDLLVIDAPSICVRRTKGGDPWALEVIDGATIKRVLDASGRTPLEGPAYQQILKGVAATSYERSELIYAPRNPRSNRVYGFSPVEQVMTTVNIALRRQLHQLSYYSDGSVPNLIFRVPKEWDADAIKRFQTWWDGLKNRKGTRFVPDGVEPVDTKSGALKDEYDEWLARIISYAFSLSPQALVKQMNRATAETAQEDAKLQGLEPLKNWLKGLMDRILREVYAAPHLEFVWEKEEALDPLELAQVHRHYVECGVLSVGEVREDMGRKPQKAEGEGTPAPGAPVAGEAVQDTALNGAQVASLLQIVQAAAQAGIPKETARAMVRASFPALSDQTINQIVDPIQPEKPAAVPAPIATPDPDQGKANSEGTGKGQSGKAGEEGPAPEPPAVSPKAEKVCSCGCGHDHDALAKAAAKKGLKPIKRNRKTVLKLQAKVQKTVGAFLAAQVRPLAEAILSEVSKAQAASDLQKMSRDEALKILQAVGMNWTALGDDLEPLLSAIAQDGGSAGLAQIGKTTEDLLEQVNERAVAWAEKHAAELVTKVTDVTRDRIAGDVAAAIELGMSVDELADALASTYAFSDQRAELIATTERAFADVAGNRLAYGASGVVGGLEWVTANGGGDERTCEECDSNNGAVVPMDEDGNATEPFPSGATSVPAHPGCFVSGTVVSAVGVSKHFKRWFAGEVVTLSIEGNDDLTATPNHPILTRRGWVAAAKIQQGDEVIKCLDPQTAVLLLGPYDHHIETRIEEMADALAMAGRVSSARVPTSPEDFHGDGLLNQDVDVVWAEVGLRSDSQASTPENIGELKFQGALIADSGCSSEGATDPHVDGLPLAPDGGVGRFGSAHPFSGPSGLSLDKSGLCECPDLGTSSAKDMTNRQVVAAVASSDSRRGLTTRVSLADDRDLGIGKAALECLGASAPADLNSMLGEDAIDDLLGDTKLLSKLLRMDAGLVTTAKVERVTRNEFAGHVFNLQTVDGWYFANSIVAHNCICDLLPVVSETEE